MHFSISSRAEAQAYLAHPVLGPRLRECVQIILDLPPDRTAADVFAWDDVKVRSSLTLFAAVAPDEPLFGEALRRFYDGDPDPRTLAVSLETAAPWVETTVLLSPSDATNARRFLFRRAAPPTQRSHAPR